jgi:periplasmic protein TonB
MFDNLPETNPHKNKKKPRAIALAAGIQVVLVSAIIVVQMAMPEKLGEFQLLTTLYMAPPPPPPPAPLSPAPQPQHHAVQKATVAQTPAVAEPEPERPPVEKPELMAPTTVPKDIARIVDAGPPSAIARGEGGVAGGVSGGVGGGLLGGVLGGAGSAPSLPPPTAPIRVGGNVKEPKIVHIEQPKYPPEAKRAKVEGVVILEATVTAEGAVDKVKVISGPPMLIESAVEAVSHWKYEPTYLNGQAVPVILTARINFSLAKNP